MIESGIIVVIESPDFFRGRKLAVTMNKCKWHENAIECMLMDPNATVKKVCVGLSKPGDKLFLLSDLNLEYLTHSLDHAKMEEP